MHTFTQSLHIRKVCTFMQPFLICKVLFTSSNFPCKQVGMKPLCSETWFSLYP